MGDYARAEETWRSIIRQARAAGDLFAELYAASGLALLAAYRGQLHTVLEVASQALEHVERSGTPPPIAAALYGEMGLPYCYWGQPEKARYYFRRAAEVSGTSSFSDAEVYNRVVLSRMFQMEGNLQAAAEELQKALDLGQADAPVRVREEVIAQQVRLSLAQGHLAAAEEALQGSFGEEERSLLDTAPAKIPSSSWPLYTSALRLHLYRARTRRDRPLLRRGIELADRVVTAALRSDHLPVALEALLLRGQLHAAMGNEPASLADYARALELGAPEGFVSPFVEEGAAVAKGLSRLVEQKRLGSLRPAYVEQLLEALAGPQPAPSADQGEPLSGRELEVLRCIAEGLTYREVAERLVISLNTVRSHVKAVYGKLGVDNRTRAIEVARKRQLL
jgi:LuxR family maltose regulon positive regulatory protein